MAQSLRNLQIFRNGELLTSSIADVKDLINGAFTAGTIVLKDGEPISIRYKETNEPTAEIKSLFGVAYVPEKGTPSILWNESGITIDTNPKEGDYVTLNYVVDEKTGNYTLTVAAQIAETIDGEGLATASVVKSYVEGAIETAVDNIVIPEVPVYTIQETATTEGYLKSYQLLKDGTGVGDVINIPKDYLVKDASIITVTEDNKPQENLIVGETYIDFVINTKDNIDNVGDKHLYINVTELVDVYTQGNGISIDDNNTISVKITEGEQYIVSDTTGIHTTEALQSAIEDSTKTAISNLGTAKAEEGKVITSIGVNDEGKLFIEETELPEGEVYYGGHDIKVSTEMRGEDTETKNYIDTSLDAAIESCVTIGNLNNGETLTAGMTLSQILEKILVKEFQPQKTLPSTQLNISPTLKGTYEVGETLGTLTLTHTYTDGYYSADGTNYKKDKFNSLHENEIVSDNKLLANCTEGETIYKFNDETISSTYNGTEKLTEGEFTFKCQTSYGASDVIPMTNLGKNATKTITSGSTTISSITKNVYYKAYSVIISNNEIPANISDLMTDSNGYFITSDTVKKTDTYNIQGGESMFLFLPQSKTFTINNSLGSPSQSEFVKKQEVTNTLETVYNVYQKRNDSDKTAGYKELTFAKVQ